MNGIFLKMGATRKAKKKIKRLNMLLMGGTA
jgi:hypothetical protein